MARYSADSIMDVLEKLAQCVGVSAADSGILAKSLVTADLQGTSTHGVSRFGTYMRRIQQGLIKPNTDITIEKERAAVIAVNANNGLGQVQAWKVLDRLVPMARSAGCASATIRNSQHFGALSFYCNRAAGQGMILLATTNCEPSMSPAGACDAFFGTNPIAVSFPTGKGFPVKIDLATSVVARGNIIAAKRRGKSVPEGWALDREGNPTTDAEQALLGTVLTMAGHKGYALALMVEVLSGVLSGAAIGPDVGSMYTNAGRPQDVGHFFMLLDIDAFMERRIFLSRIDRTIDRIKACRKRPGVEEILVPGERSYRTAEENRIKGIPLGEETIGELDALSQDVNGPAVRQHLVRIADPSDH
jgi:LDH2 family malate/lactate/ureidoglycolate dehydrogenase